MPAMMRKLPKQNRYRVFDSKGHIHAKSTTKRKAEAQIRLLNGVRHGMVTRKRK